MDRSMAPLNLPLPLLKGSTDAIPDLEKTEAEVPLIPAVFNALTPVVVAEAPPPPLARKKLVNGDSPGSLTVKFDTTVLREGR